MHALKRPTQTLGHAEPAKELVKDELLTVHEIAVELRVDDTTVRRWIKFGVLEAVALPHRGNRQAYRIKRGTLDSILAGGIVTL